MYHNKSNMKKMRKKGYPKKNNYGDIEEDQDQSLSDDEDQSPSNSKNSYADFDPDGKHNPYHMGEEERPKKKSKLKKMRMEGYS